MIFLLACMILVVIVFYCVSTFFPYFDFKHDDNYTDYGPTSCDYCRGTGRQLVPGIRGTMIYVRCRSCN